MGWLSFMSYNLTDKSFLLKNVNGSKVKVNTIDFILPEFNILCTIRFHWLLTFSANSFRKVMWRSLTSASTVKSRGQNPTSVLNYTLNGALAVIGKTHIAFLESINKKVIKQGD